jgi:hypothetical protein
MANGSGSATCDRDVGSPVQPCGSGTPGQAPAQNPPPPARRFVEIHWVTADGWCSEPATVAGTTENYGEGENVAITVTAVANGSQLASFNESVHGQSLSHNWTILEVLPTQSGGHYVNLMDADAHAEGQTTPTHLHIHFIPTVPKTHYAQNRAHFDLTATDYEIKIESEIKYVKGWGGSVVQLGPAVPAGTGGLLDGQLTWNGYRWMKSVAGNNVYWDGAAWQNLPAGFALIDANNFAVGFYKTGATYTCQYGGTWPEAFTDWDLTAADKQARIQAWTDNIHTVWTGKFDIKRHECQSTAPLCCRYSTTASAVFTLEAAFAAGMLVIADGNIRSNDSLWFIGEPRIAVAGHEFGHHLGNPDEYAGSALDTTLNGDGAVAGIDADSIMGQNLTNVKKRHYRTICTHFAAMVQTLTGKTYTYEAVGVVARTGPAGGGGGGGGVGWLGGALLGALAGAIAGGIAAYVSSGGNWKAAAIGAGTGAVAGAIVGGIVGASGGGAGAAMAGGGAAGALAGLATGLTKSAGWW